MRCIDLVDRPPAVMFSHKMLATISSAGSVSLLSRRKVTFFFAFERLQIHAPRPQYLSGQ